MLSTSVLETIRKPPLAEGCPNCIRKTRNTTAENFCWRVWCFTFYITFTIHNHCPNSVKTAAASLHKFYWNCAIGCWVMAKKNDFQYGGCPPSWILKKSYLFTWLSLSSKYAVMYQISSKSANCSSRNGDLMICNMAAICHVEFWNLEFVTWPLLPCYSASLCKISLKSYNRVLSYGKKRFLKWWKIF